jgi:hypothetical protein
MDYLFAAISSVLLNNGDGNVTAAEAPCTTAVTFTVYFRNFVN